MFRSLTVLSMSALLTATAFAQQPSPDQTNPTQAPAQSQPSSQPQTNPQPAPVPAPNAQAAPASTHITRLAPGSVLPVQLTKTIDARKAKTGDEVIAKVTGDLKNNSGTVIVPKDSKVVGHVTEAQARHKDQKESQLSIAFDQAVVNGETMQMPMSIQAVIALPSQNQNQSAAAEAPSGGYPGGASGAEMPSGGSSPAGAAGRSSSPQPTGGEQMPQAPQGSTPQTASQPQPQITGNTKGVVGISNLSLAPTSDPLQGSMLTSEKNNVKLEGGTIMLLRVSQ